MKRTIAIKLVGGCSETSKMPGMSYGLPTSACKMGAKLMQIPGTVCSECYANKGFYKCFASTAVPAQERRLEAIQSPEWCDAMVAVLRSERWFRWFDSGDLQSVEMLLKIFEVAERTPWCHHWVATRERAFVRQALRRATVPDNLVVRVSATFPDVPVKLFPGVNGSNVHKDKPPVGHECRAPQQNGKCDTCRVCWDKNVPIVSYKDH